MSGTPMNNALGGSHNADYPEPYEQTFANYVARNAARHNAQRRPVTPPQSASPPREGSYNLYPPSPFSYYQLQEDTSTDANSQQQPGGIHYNITTHHDKDQPSSPQQSTPSESKDQAENAQPAKKSRRRSTKLEEGFAWDYESLALLCRWKEVTKKNLQGAVDAGIFPGHNKTSLENVWAMRKEEAKLAYREVLADKHD